MTKRPVGDEGVWLRRTPDGFAWASDYDRELGMRWGLGSIVRADIHKPRSGKFNRWYRALVRTIWKHQNYYATPDALHLALKFRLGFVDHVVFHTGEATLVPRSTAYDVMEEGDFHEYVSRTWDVIVKEIIPGLDARGRRELTAEIDRLVAGSGT